MPIKLQNWFAWLMGIRWIWHQPWFLFLWKLYKWTLHHCFQQSSELERLSLIIRFPDRYSSITLFSLRIPKDLEQWEEVEIESLAIKDPFLMLRFDKSLLLSRQLEVSRRHLESKQTIDIFSIYIRICQIKEMSEKNATLFDCFLVYHATFRLLHDLTERCLTPYDVNNKNHEKKLMEFWSLFFPQTPLQQRLTRQWELLGFQGMDPATDFRGMGIFGLDALYYGIKKYPKQTRKIWAKSRVDDRYIPFACAGIRLLSFVIGLLRRRELQYFLYQIILKWNGQWHERSFFPTRIQQINKEASKLEKDILFPSGDLLVNYLRDCLLDLFVFMFGEFDNFFDQWMMKTTDTKPAVLQFPTAFDAYKNWMESRFRSAVWEENPLSYSLVKQSLAEKEQE